MAKYPYTKNTPQNIDEYIELLNDRSDYTERLKAISYLKGFKCHIVIKNLHRLMMYDRIYDVKEQAFRALQNFGENVKLPRKKKGKPVKTINEKLRFIHNSFNGNKYDTIDFKFQLKKRYPEVYDIYQYEKKDNFDSFIQGAIKSFPKSKIDHILEIDISFKNSPNISSEIIKNHIGAHDIEIKSNKIKIHCKTNSKIRLESVINEDNNIHHKAILKSLMYYYVKLNHNNPIENIELRRIDSSQKTVTYTIPNKSVNIEQIVSLNYTGIDISENKISCMFNKTKKSEAMYLSISYLIKAKTASEHSVVFENLWKSFNAIYRYIGNERNDNESQQLLRSYTVTNETIFPKSIYAVSKLNLDDIQSRVRFSDMLLSDYDTDNKIKAFVHFVFRHNNNFICKCILDNLEYLKNNIISFTSDENKRRGLNRNAEYSDFNTSSPTSVYNSLESYLTNKSKVKDSANEIELVTFCNKQISVRRFSEKLFLHFIADINKTTGLITQ